MWLLEVETPTRVNYNQNDSYKICLSFASDYPASAPLIQFLTPIQNHPWVDAQTNIMATENFADTWQPDNHDVLYILDQILASFSEPALREEDEVDRGTEISQMKQNVSMSEESSPVTMGNHNMQSVMQDVQQEPQKPRPKKLANMENAFKESIKQQQQQN